MQSPDNFLINRFYSAIIFSSVASRSRIQTNAEQFPTGVFFDVAQTKFYIRAFDGWVINFNL